jgi:hypothetical protein
LRFLLRKLSLVVDAPSADIAAGLRQNLVRRFINFALDEGGGSRGLDFLLGLVIGRGHQLISLCWVFLQNFPGQFSQGLFLFDLFGWQFWALFAFAFRREDLLRGSLARMCCAQT